MTTSRLVLVLFAAAALCGDVLAAAAPRAAQPIPGADPGLRIDLQCSMRPSDVVRVHDIKNTTAYPIPAGTPIRFSNPQGDQGAFSLQQALGPGATVSWQTVGISNGGSCVAYFFAGYPDLVVEQLGFVDVDNSRRIRMVIKNLNNFVPAGASKALLQGYKCPETLVQSKQVDIPALPGGGSVTHYETAQAATIWLRATANSTNSVRESNASNNGLSVLMGNCAR